MDNNISKKLGSACTTIIVGETAMADGSRVFARSEDLDATMGKMYLIFKDTNNGPREYVARDSSFRCPLPAKALGYSAMPDYKYPNEWGSAGFNTAGVGMSSTETIFSSAKALAADPYVEGGLAENVNFNIVLPYIHTAREGVERLGSLIEQYGSAEGFGVGFIDAEETWYLENAGGHRWLACRMPADEYFVTGNQSRYRKYDPTDKENFLASPDLVEHAIKSGLYDPSKGEFDFHEAYSRDEEQDHTYNYPRVWGLQQMLSPGIKNDVTRNTFPIYAKPAQPISIATLRKAFRFHYDGTSHDPYLHNNGKEPYRPVSIFRTCQTHILQVRPWLPQEIGRLAYVANGMADLGVFMPMYQGVTSYPKPYTVGSGQSTPQSAYWRFRKVMTLGMINYNELAPVIKDTYAAFEQRTDEKQAQMEQQYVALCNANEPYKAHRLLQEFSDAVLNEALAVTDELAERLLTMLARSVQQEYMFHGA